MTRGGAAKDRAGPERRCLVTGETGPKAGLVRFVAGPDGQVVPDILGKLPGRGMYVTAGREEIERAAAKRLFSKGARATIATPPDLAATVEALLAKRVVELISLARKSGQAVCGYEKVKGWLAEERARVLIQAQDGSGRGKSKLSTPQGGSYIGCLTASELGLAFGRDHAIHAALGTGGLVRSIVEDARKLSGLRRHDATRPASGRQQGTNAI